MPPFDFVGAYGLRGQYIKRTKRRVGAFAVTYGLVRLTNGHLVVITLGDETAILKTDRAQAWVERAFSLLVEGGVTPCTAPDVWEDLHGVF